MHGRSCSAAVQRHRPPATAGLQRAADRARSCGRPLKGNRKDLVLSTLSNEGATEVTVAAYSAANHSRAPERIETEPTFPDRHKTLCCWTAAVVRRDYRADPATLQAIPAQNPARLQMLSRIRSTRGGKEGHEHAACGCPKSEHMMA